MAADDDMLTPPEAADLARTSTRTLQTWRRVGGGPPYIRTGPQTILYRRGDLVAWLRARTVTSTSEESVRRAGRVLQLARFDGGQGSPA